METNIGQHEISKWPTAAVLNKSMNLTPRNPFIDPVSARNTQGQKDQKYSLEKFLPSKMQEVESPARRGDAIDDAMYLLKEARRKCMQSPREDSHNLYKKLAKKAFNQRKYFKKTF